MMRTCETCLKQDAAPAVCQYCDGDYSEWEPKLAAQLAAKDKIIEGLVEACEAALEKVCDGYRTCPPGRTQDDCSMEFCTSATVGNTLRAAIARAKEK